MQNSARIGDELLNIFVSNKCTSMEISTFSKLWKDQGHELNTTELCALPYIRIDNKQPAFIRLVIEQEDCCTPSCNLFDCLKLHPVNKMFCPEFEETGLCTREDTCTRFHRPNVKLMDRLIDCFTICGEETLSIGELQTSHGESFPHFESHVPTTRSIIARCPEAFSSENLCIRWKDYKSIHGDELFDLSALPTALPTTPKPMEMNEWQNINPIRQPRKQAIIPEQTEMFKIFFALNSEWTDKALVNDLLKYFNYYAPDVVLQDLYIPRRHRSGFLSFQYEADAQRFIQNTWMSRMKCGGRTIYARKWQDRDTNKNRIRVKIQNISLCVSFPQFAAWCYANLAPKESNKIYDLQIINNMVNRGADYAILCVNSRQEGVNLMKAVQGKQFRNRELTFSEWVHPDELKKVQRSRHRAASFTGFLPHDQTMKSRMRHRHSFPSKTLVPPPGLVMQKKYSPSTSDGSLGTSGTIGSTTGTMTTYTHSEWELQTWLTEDARCGQYYDLFVKHGLDSEEAMDPDFVTDRVLQNIGIEKIGDRIRILKAIRNLHL